MIYLLDTNLLGEPLRAEPNARVVSLMLQRQLQSAIAATAWEEFCFGIGIMPSGSRRRALGQYRDDLLAWNIPILPFDQAAADWLSQERARLAIKGITVPYQDATIAAVAVTRGLILVTRNTRDYKPYKGLKMENWFRA